MDTVRFRPVRIILSLVVLVLAYGGSASVQPAQAQSNPLPTTMVAVQEPIEWYSGLSGTMSGVRRVDTLVVDSATCDTDAGNEYVFSFTIPSEVEPSRFRWWALDVTTDQQLKQRYGELLPSVIAYDPFNSTSTFRLCMDDLGPLPGGNENVRTQLRLSWTAPPAPVATVGRTALLVTGAAAPSAGDLALQSQLSADGYSVTTVEDVAATPEQAAAAHLLVLAPSTTPADVGTKFRDVPVPAVVMNNALYAEMGMAASSDQGVASGQTQITIVEASSPLAGGQNGAVTVANQPADLAWARPAESAETVATLGAGDDRAVIFSYAPATYMADQYAPARRIGVGFSDGASADLSSDGLNLFSAVGDWAGLPGQPASPGSGAISGRVISNNTNVGLVDVEICATPGTPQNTPWRCDYYAVTDANGNYRITGLAAGTYHVFPIPPTGADTFFPRNVFVPVGSGESRTSFVLVGPSAWVKTEEIAHRGDRVTSPENTLEAFRRSIEKDSSYIELDVLLANNDTVVVAHGSNYQDEPGLVSPNPRDPIQSALSQVYGPTASCFGNNLENAGTNVSAMLSDCDIGSEMVILPGQKLGTVWTPKFKDERYQRLEDMLAAFPNYCGWMVELKETENTDPTINRAERNRELAQRVQSILIGSGTLDRCGQVWVTSFEDTALRGITDGRIRRMRTISSLGPEGPVPLLMWQQWVDVAAGRGYDAVNVPVQSLDTRVSELYIPFPSGIARPGSRPAGGATINYGPTLSDYVHKTGLLISAYSLTGAPPLTPLEITPELNQEAIDKRADFFMTDIIDDLMVRNGDRPQPHEAQNATVGQDERIILRNNEVFPINLSFVNGGTVQLPAEAWFVGKFDGSGGLLGEIIYPEYDEPYYEPTYRKQPTTWYIDPSGAIEVTGKHYVWENVEPDFALSWTAKDDVSFTANAITFPTADGSNPAVTGTECAAPGEQTVKNIALSATVEIPQGDPNDPATRWTLENVKVYLDGELLGESGAVGVTSVTLPASGPEVRDLAAGPHEFLATYTARNIDNPNITREVEFPQTFDAKLKPCLNGADISLVFDGSGSIPFSGFQLMQSFGISLTEALTVTTDVTNIGVIEYSSSTTVVAGLNGDEAAVIAAINGMPKSGGGTNTASAIQAGQSQLAAGRAGAPDVMIVLTDGQSNDTNATIAAAQAAKAAGITVIAVGIGAGPDNAELRGMASSVGLVFTPGSFEDLIYVLEALAPASEDPIP
ncbi:MAG: VWA domain-containing protein [Blastochloris sp.]|nr:VWA domain-containing protein [Blastochloris sp.]